MSTNHKLFGTHIDGYTVIEAVDTGEDTAIVLAVKPSGETPYITSRLVNGTRFLTNAHETIEEAADDFRNRCA